MSTKGSLLRITTCAGSFFLVGTPVLCQSEVFLTSGGKNDLGTLSARSTLWRSREWPATDRRETLEATTLRKAIERWKMDPKKGDPHRLEKTQ